MRRFFSSEMQQMRWVLIVIASAWWLGIVTSSIARTDPASEELAVKEAEAIVLGHHRFGIFHYTHYPNGPSYVLVPFMSKGMWNPDLLRLIPITISAFSIGFLYLQLLRRAYSRILRLWITGFMLTFLLQPAFFCWQGALHEHSYVMSVSLILAGLALSLGARLPFIGLFTLGYVAAWLGYDMLLAQAAVFFSLRWMMLMGRTEQPLTGALRTVILETCALGLGMSAAIASHLLQNALYFGSVDAARAEFGSILAARSGANSESFKSLYGIQPLHATRLATNWALLKIFLFERWPDWASRSGVTKLYREGFSMSYTLPWLVLPCAVGWFWTLRQHSRCLGQNTRTPMVMTGAALGTTLICFGWTLVMPEHAAYHFHYLPRHWLLACLVLACLPLALPSVKSQETPASPPKDSFL